MEIGIVGLGRMGMGIGKRLARDGHIVTGFDVSPDKQVDAEASGFAWRPSVRELAASLPTARIVWIMVPAGQPVDDAITEALPALSPGDIVIDGGNSYFKDSMRRTQQLSEKGIYFLDAGVSGGIWRGLEEGFCLMVGGDEAAFRRVEPVFASLAPADGYIHAGRAGAGHYVKMVANGIDTGMLQAYGEGFEILHASEFDFDLKSISQMWNHGSVIRSWLLELASKAFEEGNDLAGIAGWIDDTGEGRWTVQQAINVNVPAPVISKSAGQAQVAPGRAHFPPKSSLR